PLGIGIADVEGRVKEPIVVGQVADGLDLRLDVVAGVDLVELLDACRGSPARVRQVAVDGDRTVRPRNVYGLARQRRLRAGRWREHAERQPDGEQSGESLSAHPSVRRQASSISSQSGPPRRSL